VKNFDMAQGNGGHGGLRSRIYSIS